MPLLAHWNHDFAALSDAARQTSEDAILRHTNDFFDGQHPSAWYGSINRHHQEGGRRLQQLQAARAAGGPVEALRRHDPEGLLRGAGLHGRGQGFVAVCHR